MFKKHDILIILEILGIVLLCIIPQFNAGAVATYLIILATCACILLWLLIENHTRKRKIKMAKKTYDFRWDYKPNVLGHALLKNKKDGVYCYVSFNDTDAGKQAKNLVTSGDKNALSIFANQLKQKGGDVIHCTCTWCVIGCVIFGLLALRFDMLWWSIIGIIFVIICQIISFAIINKEDDDD